MFCYWIVVWYIKDCDSYIAILLSSAIIVHIA